MFTIALYGSTVCLLLASFFKDLKRTEMALKKSWKALENILIFVGAWATTKIPMLLFEAGSMGWSFMLIRLTINIPGVIIMAYMVEMLVLDKEKKLIYQSGLSL